MNVPHCFFVDYPTEKRMLEWLICAAVLSTAQTGERAKIGNPRVYIYRATSVMLTSLCVSFWKPPGAYAATSFQRQTHLSCWSLVSRLRPLGGEAVRWAAAEVVRCSGGGLTKWHQGVGWAVGAVACGVSLLAIRPYNLGVHSTSLLYARRGSCRPLLTHTSTQSCIHARTNALHSSRHERSWVFKALALSGNSWLGRHGGSWLLLVLFLLFVV